MKVDDGSDLRVALFGDELMKANIKELSRQTGVPTSTLYKYKSNPMMMPVRTLRAICRVQDIDPEQIGDLILGR